MQHSQFGHRGRTGHRERVFRLGCQVNGWRRDSLRPVGIADRDRRDFGCRGAGGDGRCRRVAPTGGILDPAAAIPRPSDRQIVDPELDENHYTFEAVNGFHCYTGKAFPRIGRNLTDGLSQGRNATLFANFKLASLEVPAQLSDLQDLFEEARSEIDEELSLHLISSC